MLHIFLLAVLAVATAHPSPEPYEGPKKVVDLRYGGPAGILRFADNDEKDHDHGIVPDIEAQNRIIASVYSPAFLQPIWIVDYRLTPLKGKDYKAEFGKPVLVLPRHKPDHDKDNYRRDDDRNEDRMRGRGNGDRQRDRNHDNEGPQVVELNRLREIARDGYRRAHGEVKHMETDHKHMENDHKHKGYNPSWATLPEVAFAGRNHGY